MWTLFDDGSTIGTKGSEDGVIIKDEEHNSGARITIEKEVGNSIPFAITCGIYGLFVHTVYCSDSEVMIKYESMKHDIDKLLKELSNDNMSGLIDDFINKY